MTGDADLRSVERHILCGCCGYACDDVVEVALPAGMCEVGCCVCPSCGRLAELVLGTAGIRQIMATTP